MSTTRRTFLSATLAGLAACGTPPGPPAPPALSDTADTGPALAERDGRSRLGAPPRRSLGVVMLGFDGVCMRLLDDPSVPTPNYDRLRAEAVACERVYATYPLCAPARAAVLTGLPPHENGQIENSFVLNEQIPTLVRHFADQGMVCRLWGKQHSNIPEEDGVFGYHSVLNRDGEQYVEAARRYKLDETARIDAQDAALFDEIEAITGVPLGGAVRPRSIDPDWVLLNEAIHMIRVDAITGRSFFANIQLLAPHHPYSLPEDVYYAFAPQDIELLDEDVLAFEDSAAGRSEDERHRWSELTDEHRRLILARQYAAHVYADTLLGHLLDKLDRMDLLEDLVFVLTTDHGEMAGAKGLFLKKVFEEDASRVAFVVRHPDLPGGTSYRGLMSGLDLLPTLGGLAGLPEMPGIRGLDLSGALLRAEPGRPAVFVWLDMYARDGAPVVCGAMVRTQRYKYARFTETRYPDGPMEQLYDLAADPQERENLVGRVSYEAARQELAASIDRELATYGDPLFPLERS